MPAPFSGNWVDIDKPPLVCRAGYRAMMPLARPLAGPGHHATTPLARPLAGLGHHATTPLARSLAGPGRTKRQCCSLQSNI
jgi:hypothetical protein